jgi:protein-S-isoprenylcysteine O-methyltransferase Ste14
MEISGKPTIHPSLFISGKIAGYFTWLVLVLALSGYSDLRQSSGLWVDYSAYVALSAGFILVLISSLTMGRSIRIGLPSGETSLRTGGIYRFSRNPMYLGVHLITLAAMLLTLKWWVIIPGIFSVYAYHQITLGEEKFLEERFGNEYLQYKKSTRRY